jgi:hypothetical protein
MHTWRHEPRGRGWTATASAAVSPPLAALRSTASP